jgi:peptide-methionine (S)-S-oxide reductase
MNWFGEHIARLGLSGRIGKGVGLVALACVALVAFAQATLHAGETATLTPAPAVDQPMAPGKAQIAVLSGGCFWAVQGVFQHVKGVEQVWSGYAGGDKSTATYEQVSTGTTGHAETVEIAFDPAQISYGQILHVFFSVAHDPTEVNHQGPDVGPQYRSLIFFVDADQQRIAQAYIAQLDKAGIFSEPITTQVEAFKGFFTAESYHQNYLVDHPAEPYIVINDQPKIVDLKRLFPDLYRDEPVLTTAALAPS